MNRDKSEIEYLTEISIKLDCLLHVMMVNETADDANSVVKKLNGMGLGKEAIANITGLTVNAVNIRLTRLKQQASGKRRKR